MNKKMFKGLIGATEEFVIEITKVMSDEGRQLLEHEMEELLDEIKKRILSSMKKNKIPEGE